MNKKVFALVLVFLISAILVIVSFVNKETPEKVISVPKESVYTNENISITLGFPNATNTDIQKPNSISSVNLKNGEVYQLLSSNTSINIPLLNKENKVVSIGDNAYFVAYEYTELDTPEGKHLKQELGYIFKITKEGKVSKAYTTENIFTGATIENNKIVIHEKIYLDDMNMYPSYYKPYILVKKVFDGVKVKEVSREEIFPNKK